MMTRLWRELLPFGVLAALPAVGTLAGPAYAPLVFGAAALLVLCRAAVEQRWPHPDPAWLALAALFAALSWASATWSLVPDHSLRGAIQMTALLGAALVLVAQPPPAAATARLMLRALALAFLLGGLVLTLDTWAGYPLQRWLSADAANAATKYNRGVAYALLLACPVLGLLWRERALGFAACVALGLGLMLGLGLGLTARLAALAAVAGWALARLLPRLAGALLMAATGLFAGLTPLLVRALSLRRDELAPYLKQSGAARLEIWNYMTVRVFERPLFGHGFWSANFLTVRPAELARYSWVTAKGVYPHDQWLQLWVELGAAGAAIGIAAAVLALSRVPRLEPDLRPFAYAAYAAAMTLSLADFDLATDSWWAALALCAWLFRFS